MCISDPAEYAGHAQIRAKRAGIQACAREVGATPFDPPAQDDEDKTTPLKPRPVAILAGVPTHHVARSASHIEASGYAVLVAACASETLEAARLWSARLVLIDIDNIDDYAPRLIASLAADDGTAPARRIIAMGDFIPDGLRLQLQQAGADGCFQRPISGACDLLKLDAFL
ncbi:hypothetical protein [Gymnodinialimonas ulvae]|uniref:hypothetical protein n=1 Tax=Gymnodinialimonas ulvae TaxID=3126504 RepID=UPI0030A2A345